MANNKNEDQNEESLKNHKNESKMSSAEERSEYFKKLEKWLQEAYIWQSVAAMFPYYVMSNQILNPLAGLISYKIYILQFLLMVLRIIIIIKCKKIFLYKIWINIITGATPFGPSVQTMTSAEGVTGTPPQQQNDLQRQRGPQEPGALFRPAEAEGRRS